MRLVRAILIVTALGAAAGALVGFAAMLGLVVFRNSGQTPRDLLFLLGIATGVGAAYGLALGPMLGFGLLRHVPLWRAILCTAVGALLGLAVGFLVNLPLFVAPVVGMLVAAVVLRLTSRPAAASAPTDPVA